MVSEPPNAVGDWSLRVSQLSWVRLEVGLRSNPKILGLLNHRDGYPAVWLFMCGLMYSGEHGLDGWVPEEALVTFGGCYAPCYASRYAKLLVQHGLWEPQPGGFVAHDWAEFQASSDESHARTARAREASRTRWNGHKPQSNAARQAAYRARQGQRNPPDF
jgi:hypothetical protein